MPSRRILLLTGIFLISLLACIPIGMHYIRSAQHQEMMDNVNDLRIMELAYKEAFGAYISAPLAPRPLETLDKKRIPLGPAEGFSALHWKPHEKGLRASYEIVADDSGFLIRATCDLDEDGEVAIFEATHTDLATVVTAKGIY